MSKIREFFKGLPPVMMFWLGFAVGFMAAIVLVGNLTG